MEKYSEQLVRESRLKRDEAWAVMWFRGTFPLSGARLPRIEEFDVGR